MNSLIVVNQSGAGQQFFDNLKSKNEKGRSFIVKPGPARNVMPPPCGFPVFGSSIRR
jgi:hypothetical protein